MISTISGAPVELAFTPGSYQDIRVFKQLDLGLPRDSSIYTASGFTAYAYEDALKEDDGINLFVARKSNSKHPHSCILG